MEVGIILTQRASVRTEKETYDAKTNVVTQSLPETDQFVSTVKTYRR